MSDCFIFAITHWREWEQDSGYSHYGSFWGQNEEFPPQLGSKERHRTGVSGRLPMMDGEVAHSYIWLPSHSRPLPHCPTQANVNEKWQKSDIPQVASSPVKNSKRASTDPMELGEPGPSRRTTSDSSSWHNGHISGKELSRLSVLIIGGSSGPLSCPKHWNNWWYWTIVPGEC